MNHSLTHSLALSGEHTIEHNLLCEVVYIAAPLHVLPQVQIPTAGLQQICDGLIVDLQKAAFHTVPHLVSSLHHQHLTAKMCNVSMR